MRKNSERVLRLTQLSLLMAVELILSLTPLGYLMTPWGTQITFIVVPVAVGAVFMGPAEGAFLGLVFGLTSFWQALTKPGVISSLALQANPIGLFFILVCNRVLVGLAPGLIYAFFRRSAQAKIRTAGVALCCALTPLINTFLYIVGQALILADVNLQYYGGVGHLVSGRADLVRLMLVLFAPNYISETLTCLLLGTAVCKALQHAFRTGGK